jgi:hypothetical protein
VDFADDAGFTALHHAVSSGFEDFVDELISKGADINVLASCGVVLNVAADKGRSHIAEILLRARADCDAAIAFAEDSGFDVGVLREFLTQALRSSGLESTSALYSVAETNHWGKPTLTNTRVASGDVDEYKHDPRSTKTSSYTSETVGDGTLVERTHGPRITRPGLGTHARSEEDMDLYDYDSYSTKYSSLTASVDTNTQQRHVPNITQSSESSLKQASSIGSFFGTPTERKTSESAEEAGELGLTTLYTPKVSSNHATADLIFIHGIGGGSRATWTFNGNPSTFWPLEWLPKGEHLRNTSIHTFGYEPGIRERTAPPDNDIGMAATSLLQWISESPGIDASDEVGCTMLYFLNYTVHLSNEDSIRLR